MWMGIMVEVYEAFLNLGAHNSKTGHSFFIEHK